MQKKQKHPNNPQNVEVETDDSSAAISAEQGQN